jgi:glycosyltransferase involved in cell wall biosynthesis
VDFFSKPSFVDPGPTVGQHSLFQHVPVINYVSDGARRCCSGVPLVGKLASINDARRYNVLIVDAIKKEQNRKGYDAVLWMGDYARGNVPSIPSISFVQGPPGTDARSFLSRFHEIRKLSGAVVALKWRLLAKMRLSRMGLPNFTFSDLFIVGSGQSKSTLQEVYGVESQRISVIPYPIDLANFNVIDSDESTSESQLRIIWLGRVVPRKRLDLFLEAAALLIREGLNIQLTIVGGVGMIPQYKKMIDAFEFQKQLNWIPSLPREQIPQLLRDHHILVQPSDEENFGSSVAEAQACGLPVVVGKTNGNADYLCSQDIHLGDDKVDTLAMALRTAYTRKQNGKLGNKGESRANAERHFDIRVVEKQLVQALDETIVKYRLTH